MTKAQEYLIKAGIAILVQKDDNEYFNVFDVRTKKLAEIAFVIKKDPFRLMSSYTTYQFKFETLKFNLSPTQWGNYYIH